MFLAIFLWASKTLDCEGKDFAKDVCLSRIPCESQNPPLISKHCVDTFYCKKPKKIDDVTVLAIFLDTELKGVVGLNKKMEFKKLGLGYLSHYDEMFFSLDKVQKKLTFSVDYDGVETERCDYFVVVKNYNLKKLDVAISDKNAKFNLNISAPNKEDLQFFGKNFKLCPKQGCMDETHWKLYSLWAVSDFNNNGHKEYWYSFQEGYRTFFGAKEFTQTWNEIFFH